MQSAVDAEPVFLRQTETIEAVVERSHGDAEELRGGLAVAVGLTQRLEHALLFRFVARRGQGRRGRGESQIAFTNRFAAPHHQTLFVNRPREFGIRYMKRWGD